ncbi:MAG: phage shock protein PspA [Candidatus Sumerlaeota bacterium]|nr:phage shock protein PspA [Candidatus Sumerlaeota bacterium]
MGIFTRFRDIVASNLNAILDRAEDPEKMVRLMIQEMEDTLVEVKASCAGVIAEQKKLERALDHARFLEKEWASKAELAVAKGRDDLARGALAEKSRFARRAESLGKEIEQIKETVLHFQSEIAQLEAKLNEARDKQRTILQRRAAAMASREAQARIRKVDTSEAFTKFEAFEQRVDRMEAEADLVNSLRPKDALREEFSALERAESIERELEELKQRLASAPRQA